MPATRRRAPPSWRSRTSGHDRGGQGPRGAARVGATGPNVPDLPEAIYVNSTIRTPIVPDTVLKDMRARIRIGKADPMLLRREGARRAPQRWSLRGLGSTASLRGRAPHGRGSGQRDQGRPVTAVGLRRHYPDYIATLNERRFDDLPTFVADELVYNDVPVTGRQYRELIEDDVQRIPDLFFDVRRHPFREGAAPFTRYPPSLSSAPPPAQHHKTPTRSCRRTPWGDDFVPAGVGRQVRTRHRMAILLRDKIVSLRSYPAGR